MKSSTMVKKTRKNPNKNEISNNLFWEIFDTFAINLVMYSQSTTIIRAIYPILWSLLN